MKTALVSDARLPDLRAQIEKLSKRAARLGVQAPVLTVGESVQVPYCTDSDGRGLYRLDPSDLARVESYRVLGTLRYRSFRQCSVFGESVVVAGWEFVATLQHLRAEDGTTVNLLRTVPTFEGSLPERFRTAGPEWCDHCHTKRARKDTYVLRRIEQSLMCGKCGFLRHAETDTCPACSAVGGRLECWQQVGRTCTQDFLGDRDPEKFLASLDLLLAAALALDESGGEEGGGGGHFESSVPTLTYLEIVAMLVRTEGWVSRGQARNASEFAPLRATADEYLTPPRRDAKAYADWRKWVDAHPVEQQDRDTARRALDYARADLLDGRALSDYEHNLSVACQQAALDRRTLGIAASLISYFLREVERVAQSQRAATVSKHVGAVKERLLLQVTCERVITCESDWGTSYLHRLHDAAGNSLVWFSSDSGNNIAPGRTVWVKATVKAHGEYHGVAQTTLVRWRAQ